jgi:hypothetical protein
MSSTSDRSKQLPTRPLVEIVDPLPFELGPPPTELWSVAGVAPSGEWRLLGVRATTVGFLIPCPCCCWGWAALVPDLADTYGYRPAHELGCTRDCRPEAIAWWLCWRLGELPAEELEPPTPRTRAYAEAAARAEIRGLAQASARRDPARALRIAAYRIGQVLEPGSLQPASVEGALRLAGCALGLEAGTAGAIAELALATGRAKPRRLPR